MELLFLEDNTKQKISEKTPLKCPKLIFLTTGAEKEEEDTN